MQDKSRNQADNHFAGFFKIDMYNRQLNNYDVPAEVERAVAASKATKEL
jgi:hypothetical protein